MSNNKQENYSKLFCLSIVENDATRIKFNFLKNATKSKIFLNVTISYRGMNQTRTSQKIHQLTKCWSENLICCACYM